ncbi:MAG: glycosyltransferase family 1 protein [Actinobacteria bacterium]|nr:glycosyltransferase family 1 protein [Actinomycetota bacterium]
MAATPAQHVAVLSLHTSPLAQPGVGDGGGMNVYVRELTSSLARLGVQCTTYTRAWKPGLADVVDIEPNHRLVHVRAGDFDVPKEQLIDIVPEFTDMVSHHLRTHSAVQVIHANYWLSGLAGHSLKHDLNLPLITTFHTLARVKALHGDAESRERDKIESSIIGCSDAIFVSCEEERDQFRTLYGDSPGTVEVITPGVERAYFSPGSRSGARSALSLGAHPVLLFVGRIQPLKGLDVAIEALAALRRSDAVLLVVGGASGRDGEAELQRVNALAESLGVARQIRFVAPQPHHLLATYYRAADVVLVPSRSESFGLVALEASACGTPVVATAVGGLLSLVDDGVNGFLVPERDGQLFAKRVAQILDDGALADAMRQRAVQRSAAYSWQGAARRMRRVVAEFAARDLVLCS